MKKLILGILLISPSLFAAPQDELSSRLRKVKGFTAVFKQIVTDPENRVISKGEGKVAISRPNLFRWETKTPDENLLVSDGKTLWYYSPFLQQVTAMWMDEATSQTPFVLLTRNNSLDWRDYKVTQRANHFTLVPKVASNMKEFSVDVLPDGKITKFSVVEMDGQASRFNFDNIKETLPAAKLFRYNIPKGVELDDQRQ